MRERFTEVKHCRRMAKDKDTLPAAEARKALGASMTADLIPRPPALIGREACFQLWSSKWMLQILSSKLLCTLSNSERRCD